MKGLGVVLLLVAVAIACAGGQQTILQNDDLSIKVNSKGTINFYPTEHSHSHNNSNKDGSSKQYSIRFISLVEYDQNITSTSNNVHLAASNFTLSPVHSKTFQNLSVSHISMTTDALGGCFSIGLCLFMEEGDYQLAGQTFHADNNTFIWAVNVTGWPFLDSNNTLDVHLVLKTPGHKASWDDQLGELSMKEAKFMFPSQAMYDSQLGDMLVSTMGRGSVVDIHLLFSASTEIDYCPQACLTSKKNKSN